MNARNSGMSNHRELQPYRRPEVPSPYLTYPGAAGRYADAHLRDYLNVILRRKRHVAIFFVATVVLAMIVSLLMTPLYQATTVIKIDTRDPNMLSVPGLAVKEGSNFYQTQYEILKSRSLAEKVIRNLNIVGNKDFLPPDDIFDVARNIFVKPVGRFITGIASAFSSDKDSDRTSAASAAPVREEIPAYLSTSLITRLDVAPVKDSQLVKVSFVSHKPAMATQVVNAVADGYIEYDLESRVDSSRQAREFLQDQIQTAKKKIEASEKALNDYAAKNTIIFIDSHNQSADNKNFSEVSTALSTVVTERLQKEALFREVSEPDTQHPLVINNPLIQGLKREHATLEAEYFNLSKTFTPDYPKMKNLKSQIDAIGDRINRERSNIVRSVRSDYQAALKKEENLKQAFTVQQNKVLDFQGRAVQYQILKREVDVNKESLNSLLQRLNEVGVATMSKASGIQIVDRALYPKVPYRPNLALNLFLSIMFGLMGGIGLAFVMEYFDNTVKDTDDIEKDMRLPSLGMIPLHPDLSGAKRPNLIALHSNNPVAEAFRSISTFLLLSSSSRPPKVILVTSPGEKEGKTTVCINIASALAESLGDGIIIDADMRKPKLHKSYGLDNRLGLSSCLSGNYTFDPEDGKFIKQTSVKGISMITSGPVAPNPSELLHSSRMRSLLGSLDSLFNFIIIDAPPVMGMPDSVVLSSFVDGTVLVVKAGTTPREALAETSRIFGSVNTKLLGVVLNGVKRDDLKYGYYSHYFSSYFKP